MQIPRFGVKFLLIAIAVVSLWLSTFAFYNGANEVRATIILFGLLAAGLAAAYSRGERQAFWTGFFALFLLFRVRQGIISVPTFEWLTAVIVPEPAQGGIPLAQQNLIFAGRMSVTLLLQLVFAVAAGLMAVSIHRWSRTGLKG
jgi:hypothetical protein